jgi:hypothetical protein
MRLPHQPVQVRHSHLMGNQACGAVCLHMQRALERSPVLVAGADPAS